MGPEPVRCESTAHRASLGACIGGQRQARVGSELGVGVRAASATCIGKDKVAAGENSKEAVVQSYGSNPSVPSLGSHRSTTLCRQRVARGQPSATAAGDGTRRIEKRNNDGKGIEEWHGG